VRRGSKKQLTAQKMYLQCRSIILGGIMQVEVVKWGNSCAVRLSAKAMKEIKIALGDMLEMKTQGGKIVLEPTQREYQLKELIAGINAENRHELVDFGARKGAEAW
jgi:antitoxin MazE